MKLHYLLAGLILFGSCATSHQKTNETVMSGNPLFQGWYADPEAHIYNNEYWIYPTYSYPFSQQLFMDAFSSPDLITWTKHSRVISQDSIRWLRNAMWAPSIIRANGKYYFFFGANNIQNNDEYGGIGVAVSDSPAGPFSDALGHPLIDKIVNGAQPIDQYVYRDDDGQYYMYYGGWGHCNVVRLTDDLLHLKPFDDGTYYKEVTPEHYVEGSFMLKRKGKYYFMWSEGGWTGPDYCVAYAIADSPLGPFKRVGKILQQDPDVATGAGHHSVIKGKGKDNYYIIYHRHPLGDKNGNHREVCIAHLIFEKDGTIRPVKLTTQGVPRAPLK